MKRIRFAHAPGFLGAVLLCLVLLTGCTPVSAPDAATVSTVPAQRPDSLPSQEDPRALELCRQYAQAISRQYDIEIRIGTEATEVPPWDYALEPESSAQVLWQQLDALSAWLARYPGSVLRQTAANFDSLRLCLVRTLTGLAGEDSLEQAAGLFYTRDSAAYLALAAGPYAEQTFYHEFFHAMQSCLSHSAAALEQWGSLNPAGFVYGHRDEAAPESGTYLSKGSRAFVDFYSMCSAKEDQARILEYAMLPEQEALFEEPILQEKLKTLCLGIREAYALTQEVLPWEQYLTESFDMT